MNILIREETEKDYSVIKEVNDLAFGQQNESHLIEVLRKTQEYIPELSLVAEVEDRVVGHILFYPIKIVGAEEEYTALALAPMSVHPEYQKKGIGKKLVEQGLKSARENGHVVVIVLGHEEYYPRFGFKRAGEFDIKAPFDVPENSFMVIELEEGSLKGVSGTVKYPQPFYDVA